MYVWPSGRSTTLHKNKLLKDLGPLIRKDNYGANFVPMAMDVKQFDSGYQSMIPLGVTATHVLYVNMEVLRQVNLQPARTYAELVAQVPTLRAAGKQTIIIPAQSDWVIQSCLFSMVAGRFGGADWHERVHAGRAKFTDPFFVNALAFIRQLFTDGVITQASLGMDYGDGPGQFAAGNSAYYIDGDWRAGDFITDPDTGRALIPPARQGNFQLTVFPEIPGAAINKTSSVILGTGWAINAAIPSGSKREASAWELVKWLTGKENGERGVVSGAWPNPSRTDLNTANLNIEPILRTMGSFGQEWTTGTAVIDGVFEGPIYERLNDGLTEIGLGSKTPQQVAGEVQAEYDRWRAANPR
jgi:raffinose/stachyose/melibiose transport system substrate-binding protein